MGSWNFAINITFKNTFFSSSFSSTNIQANETRLTQFAAEKKQVVLYSLITETNKTLKNIFTSLKNELIYVLPTKYFQAIVIATKYFRQFVLVRFSRKMVLTKILIYKYKKK